MVRVEKQDMHYAEFPYQEIDSRISCPRLSIGRNPTARLKCKVIDHHTVVNAFLSLAFQQPEDIASYFRLVEMIRIVKLLYDVIHRNRSEPLHLSEIAVYLILGEILQKAILPVKIQ